MESLNFTKRNIFALEVFQLYLVFEDKCFITAEILKS